jgi:hypothetical protein
MAGPPHAKKYRLTSNTGIVVLLKVALSARE